ncbi:MAG: hypothetical protein LBT59_10305 [Clostridiales bacterium]|jgi:hypothetical protein|nr:hypothetical protein [Clostridiales bacterium]
MVELILEVNPEDEGLFHALLEDYPDNADMISSEGFLGTVQFSQVIVDLMPILIPSITAIAVAMVNAGKTCRTKLKAPSGAEYEMEIKGYAFKKVKEIMSNMPVSIAKDPDVALLVKSIVELGKASLGKSGGEPEVDSVEKSGEDPEVDSSGKSNEDPEVVSSWKSSEDQEVASSGKSNGVPEVASIEKSIKDKKDCS